VRGRRGRRVGTAAEGPTLRTVFEERRGTAAVSPRRPFAARGKYYLLSRGAGKFMPRRRKFNRAARTRVCSFFFSCSSFSPVSSIPPSLPLPRSPRRVRKSCFRCLHSAFALMRDARDVRCREEREREREREGENMSQLWTRNDDWKSRARSHRSRNRFLCSRNSRPLGGIYGARPGSFPVSRT